MKPVLTFVVPVRHQDNSPDWSALCGRLKQTMASIAAQSSPNWRAIVVANVGAELPELPPGFSVERVSFPPNPHHDIRATDRETAYEAVRLDKGRRILKGMLAAKNTDYFMVVDDDDFISARLTDFVSRNQGANGWKIKFGWLWSEGHKLVVQHNDFNNYCGTSLIVRADLYALPAKFDEATEVYIKSMLGSHIKISDILTRRGAPLAVLPFRGAIYRIGHVGAHSLSGSIFRIIINDRKDIFRIKTIIKRLSSVRYLSNSMKRDFFARH